MAARAHELQDSGRTGGLTRCNCTARWAAVRPGSPITLRATSCSHTLPRRWQCVYPGLAEVVRTHPFAPDARVRPGETPVRTALSPRYLIRMRSQVQVLAGPPTIPAGHSAAGREPEALAAGLGRAGAAPPSPASTATCLSGPATGAATSTTTTHRGRHPAPRAATRQVRPPRAAACSRSRNAAAATGAPHAGLACLVVQPVKRGRRRPHPPGQAANDPRPTRDLGSVARPRPAGPSTEPPHGAAAHRDSTRSRGDGCPAAPAWCQRHCPVWEETGASGRGWTPDGWTLDGWTPDGWTPDGRTAGPGRRTGWVDTARRTPVTDAMAGVVAVSTTATTPDRSAARMARAPRCSGRAWPPPRRSAAGGTPPSGWRLGALLSLEHFEEKVERRAFGQVLWQLVGEQRPVSWTDRVPT
jgi:hypothetical protein